MFKLFGITIVRCAYVLDALAITLIANIWYLKSWAQPAVLGLVNIKTCQISFKFKTQIVGLRADPTFSSCLLSITSHITFKTTHITFKTCQISIKTNCTICILNPPHKIKSWRKTDRF